MMNPAPNLNPNPHFYKIDSEKNRFSAGKYMVIDPCYIYPDEFWSDYVHENYKDCLEGRDINGTIVEVTANNKIFKFFVSATAYGDGSYGLLHRGGEIGEIGVDSGCIAVLPLELANIWKNHAISNNHENFYHMGIIIQWNGGNIKMEDGRSEIRSGDFTFGDFSVETSGKSDYNDDDEKNDLTTEEDE